MTICGRPLIGLFLACVIVSLAPHPVRASYDSEAGRAYAVASRRLADLKKSPDKNKYRSNWIDRVRAFEQVEKNTGRAGMHETPALTAPKPTGICTSAAH
jgi:hypothetical protein